MGGDCAEGDATGEGFGAGEGEALIATGTDDRESAGTGDGGIDPDILGAAKADIGGYFTAGEDEGIGEGATGTVAFEVIGFEAGAAGESDRAGAESRLIGKDHRARVDGGATGVGVGGGDFKDASARFGKDAVAAD